MCLLSAKIFATKRDLGSFATDMKVYHVFSLKMLKHLGRCIPCQLSEMKETPVLQGRFVWRIVEAREMIVIPKETKI